MFDPFGDFDTEGYLRNFDKEKDLEIGYFGGGEKEIGKDNS